ncbi:MAG: TRAP transporter small permease subunit [Pseudomonadota bacterium]
MYRILEKTAETIAGTLALAGGAALLVLTTLTCVSIIGRAAVPLDIGLGPIRGIYDMTEVGMAAAIFAFLPYAQFTEAHARVDLFRWAIQDVLDQLLDLLFNIAMAIVAFVGTWRLYLGMQDKMSFGETTLIAQIPVWQGYAAGLVGAVGFVVVACFCVLRSGRRLALARAA